MLFRVLIGLALLSGAAEVAKPAPAGAAQIARIQVKRDGLVLLNGKAVTIAALRARLSGMARAGRTRVWYYRENPAGQPHPNVRLALQAIIDAKLPVRLSAKPDFSDSVAPK